MNEQEKKVAEELLKNPKIRNSMKKLFKTLGKDKNLTGFGISSQGKEVSFSREDIDSVNKSL